MSTRAKHISKVVLTCGLCLTAGIMIVSRLRRSMTVGEEGAQVWFYDESERELYAVPRETAVPHEGIGGTSGDGVRAIVVAPAGAKDRAQRRIAYLETCGPELKALQEDLRAARAAGRPYGKPTPDVESEFFEKNTLVRRPDETTWHDMTTPEARRIVAEWHGWRAADGSALVVCVP